MKRGDKLREYQYRLSKYGISPGRQRELEGFCYQYEEKKKELAQIYSSSSVPPEVAVMGGVPGKPTEQKAMRANQLKRDIEIIDKTLELTCDTDVGVIEPLKESVIKKPHEREKKYIPCGINKFYEYRRKFYFLLDKEKNF